MNEIVNWAASAQQIDGTLWRISVTADIDPEYHIYDTAEYEYGANPTVITFEGEGFELSGDLQTECEVKQEYDDILEFSVGTISGKALFTQDVQLLGKSADVQVNVEWMACTSTSCTPPDDTSLEVHLGSSTNWYGLGIACGIITALLAVALGAYLFKKKK